MDAAANKPVREPAQRVIVLVFFAAVFAGRVLAQLIQRVATVSFLPEFDSWQSGAVSYRSLLSSQVLILMAMAFLIARVRHGRFGLGPSAATLVSGFGIVYFAFMIGRLVAGQTFASGHSWWNALLPSIFHLVLAGFVLTLASVRRTPT